LRHHYRNRFLDLRRGHHGYRFLDLRRGHHGHRFLDLRRHHNGDGLLNLGRRHHSHSFLNLRRHAHRHRFLDLDGDASVDHHLDLFGDRTADGDGPLLLIGNAHVASDGAVLRHHLGFVGGVSLLLSFGAELGDGGGVLLGHPLADIDRHCLRGDGSAAASAT